MKITYWSDYACPYCYIGEARLKKAVAALGLEKEAEIEMKAFQLDPAAGEHATGDTQTRFARKYGLSMEHAARSIAHISELGRAEGLDFRYATTRFTSTMDAHRLTKLAQSKGDPSLAERVIERLFRAYFSDNRELADRSLLLDVAVECGLGAAEAKTVLESNAFRQDVLLDEREAAHYGIHAVPYFVIGRYAVSGAQNTEGMKETIAQALRDGKETVLASGLGCGPEGCRMG